MNNFENIETLKNKFNWGAFFLGWIWGLFNKSYITLISLPVSLIPKIGGLLNLILAIYFGIKGNEWALKNKKFNSSFSFVKYQKILSLFGFLFSSTLIILTLIGRELSALHPAGYDFGTTRAIVQLFAALLIFIYVITLPFLIIIACKKDRN